MLIQLQWQFKDKNPEFVAQKDINSEDEMIEFVKETNKEHPLPDGAIWMACEENSKWFVKTIRTNP